MKKFRWKPSQVVLLSIALSLGLAAILLSGINRASAATITVTNVNDSGAGSLRQAIADAMSGDTISFSLTGAIELTSGELILDKNLTIQGPGANALEIRRNAAMSDFRIFNISLGVRASISGLKISNGRVNSDGGGILNRGTLTIANSVISGNSATGIGSQGGGINNQGALTITDSLVSGNSVTGSFSAGGGISNLSNLAIADSTVSNNIANGVGSSGGGLHNFEFGLMRIKGVAVSGNITTGSDSRGGGIENEGVVRIINSTISGNSVSGMGPSSTSIEGGGIHNADTGTLTITTSTITDNSASGSAPSGGGIYSDSFSTRATVGNTIIAGNSAPTGPDCRGAFTSLGYNLVGNSATSFGFTSPGDQLDKDARLSPLADNGGPTQTHALMCDSPAIDAGLNALAIDENGNPLATDQRGSARIFNRTVDIGAFESQLFSCPDDVTVLADPEKCSSGIPVPSPVFDSSCGTVICNILGPLPFTVGTTTVICISEAGSSCSFTVTVIDAQPPSITCPSDASALITTPNTNCLAVNYPLPAASDNCSVTVACNPPPNACLPVGTTTVVCAATDPSNNTASCAFAVTVCKYDICIQDDATGKRLRFNSVTGEWEFFSSVKSGQAPATGRGAASVSSCKIILSNVSSKSGAGSAIATANTCTFAATATVTVNGVTHTLSDRDTRNNNCACP
jgi:hypothetical protein